MSERSPSGRTAIWCVSDWHSMYPNEATLDDVEFLVSSPNRLDVFDEIRTASQPRHELRERTDASRVTLSRILGDLEDRGWIARMEGDYGPTAEGAVVADEVAQLFANLAAIRGLRGTLEWLPVDLFDFDLSCLGDARVLASTDRNLTAAITHAATRVGEADRVRNVATGVSAEVVDAYLEGATHDDRSLETVFHASVFDTIRDDPTLRNQLDELLGSDRITVRRYDGEEPPVMLTICDDVVVMCGRPDSRSPPEGLETANPRVRWWAESYYDGIRADATPVSADPFTA